MSELDQRDEWSVISDFAECIAKRLTHKTICHLQGLKERNLQFGEDTGLVSIWDEICVQIQDEMSVIWDLYDTTVRGIVDSFVEELPRHEREALWIETQPGLEWRCADPESREPLGVFDDDLVNYLMSEVYSRADDWTNSRISTFIASRYHMDENWFRDAEGEVK